MDVEIISDITDIETIAVGSSIHVIHQLREWYGQGRWRKLKGIATVEVEDGSIVDAEIYWYEAHGIGRRRMKVKRVLE